MYHKFNYDKVNDSLFIPVKSSNNTNNLSQSTNPSRIHSAQPKIPAFLKTNDLEPSLIIQNNRTTSEYLKSVNINYNDNFATSLVIQSPVNEINLLGSPDGVIRTRSFLPEDFKENEVRRKNRVMSEKYDRIGYMKIKTKLSADNGSFGLLNSTYQPKQLTTDKC